MAFYILSQEHSVGSVMGQHKHTYWDQNLSVSQVMTNQITGKKSINKVTSNRSYFYSTFLHFKITLIPSMQLRIA